MEPISSTPKKKKRDQNLVRSIEADLDRLRDEVIRTREELEYEKIIRRTAEEQLSVVSQEKIAEYQKATDSQISDSKLQQLRSQLEEANMAITKLSAEKADFMIQLELKGSDLFTVEEKLGKMQKVHSSNLQDKSELLEELNQLVDVLNSEKQKHECELAELSRIQNGDIEMIERKEQAVVACRREIEERDLKMKRMESEMEDYLVEMESSKHRTEELKLKIREFEKVELESSSMRDILSDQRKLNSELVATNTKLIQDRNRLAAQAEQSEERDTLIEQLKEGKLNAEKLVHRLQTLLQSKEMGIEDFESKRLNSMQKEVEELANTLGELMEANNSQQNVICSLHDSIRRKDLQLSELKSHKHDCEISIAKLRTESSALQSKLIELETSEDIQEELNLLKKLRIEEEEKIDSILIENKSLQGQKQEVMKGYSQLVEENNKKSLQLIKLKQRVKQQDSDNKNLKDKLQQSETLLQAKSSDVVNLRETLKMQKSKHTSVPKGTTLQRDTHSAPSIVGRKLASVHSADSPLPNRELFMELQNLRTSYHQMQNVCKHLEQQLADERKLKEAHELESSIQLQLKDLNQENPQNKKDPDKQLVRAEQNMIEAHDWYQGRIFTLEQELSNAKCSAEDLERANRSYEKNLEDESQMRMTQGKEARSLIQESRETIRELRERTSQAEKDQTYSQRVIAQLSKRLVKSIQDYKYLQEISMSRCQELALEAKTKQ